MLTFPVTGDVILLPEPAQPLELPRVRQQENLWELDEGLLIENLVRPNPMPLGWLTDLLDAERSRDPGTLLEVLERLLGYKLPPKLRRAMWDDDRERIKRELDRLPKALVPDAGALARARRTGDEDETKRLLQGQTAFASLVARGDEPVEIQELHLRLAHMKLDEATILEFVQTHGPLGVYQGEVSREILGYEGHFDPGPVTVSCYPGLSTSPAWDVVRAQLGAARDTFDQEFWESSGSERLSGRTETVEEFRYGARLMHDLVNVFNWYTPSERPPRERPPGEPPREWACTAYGLQPPHDLAAAAEFLTSVLTEALEAFPPKVRVTAHPPDQPLGDAANLLSLLAAKKKLEDEAKWTLFDLCCLELFNDIASDAAYNECPNCKRFFLRQLGDNRHWKNSSGVKYCTVKCGNTARQRKRRQGKRNQEA